jgi:hypothetical protein
MPCRGVPQTGHASAFKVISAPQHEQKAAIFLTLQNSYGLWMNAGTAKIQEGAGLLVGRMGGALRKNVILSGAPHRFMA